MSHLKVAKKLFDSGHLYDKTNGVFVNFKNAGTINIVELEKKRFPKSIDETFVYDFDEYLVFLGGAVPTEPELPETQEPKTYMKLGAETIHKFKIPDGSVWCRIKYKYSVDPAFEGEPWEVPILIIERGSVLDKDQIFRRTKAGKTFQGHIASGGEFSDAQSTPEEKNGTVSGTMLFQVGEEEKELEVRLGGSKIKHKTQTALKYYIEIEEPVFE